MKEKAYGKINLFLDIVGKRLDNYHNLEMIMAPIDIYDELVFKKSKQPGIRISSDKEITKNPEDNLVYQVIAYMMEQHNINSGVEVTITKHIPIAAGLGGGSADAAAALRAMNRLFKLKYSKEALSTLGEKFGSDVPYCVHNKLCIARGKGEELVFLDRKLNLPVLIISPNIKVSTKQVFETVKMDQVQHRKITAMSNAIYNANCPLVKQNLYNALEPFSFKLFETIKTLKDELLDSGAEGVLMSGTGPALFVLDQDQEKLKQLQLKYRDKHYTKLTKIK